MSLYPVTKAFVWQMIENERKLGGPFSLQGAIASYLYDLITGGEISQRNYCKVWGWSHKKVRLNWEQITSTAALMHANEQGHTRGTTGAQKEAKTEQNEDIGAQQGHNRGTHLRNTTNSNTNYSANLAGGGKPQGRVREAPEPPPPPADPVDLSWLPVNDRVYAPTIAEKLSSYRPTSGDQLLTHTWRNKSSPPVSSIVQLIQAYPWPVFVAAVVIAADDRKPNLKFLNAILQRLNHEHSEAQRSAAIDPGSDADGSGIPIYDLTRHAGGAVPPGVYKGRNGGSQPSGRRQGAFKRPGERSYREHLEACGYTPEQIAAITAQDDHGGFPAGGADQRQGSGESAVRPLLRLRA